MTDLRKRLDKALSVPPENLPTVIRSILAPDPRNVEVLNHVVKTFRKLDLEGPVLVKCVCSLIENALADYTADSNDDSDENLIKVLCHSLFLIVTHPVPAQDAVRFCRCMVKLLPVQTLASNLAILVKILSASITLDPVDYADPYIQESGLWYIWYSLQVERYTEVKSVNIVDLKLSKWTGFSITLMKKWALILKPVSGKLACKITCALIRLTALCKKDVFQTLANLELKSPLRAATVCLSERRFMDGFHAAETGGVSEEYACLVNILCPFLITNIQQEKKDYLRLAKTSVSMFECYLKFKGFSLENILLLLRHVIYYRSCLEPDDLDKLMEMICRLDEIMPFDDKEHNLWKTESLSKVANNIANVSKDCKNDAQSRVIEQIFVKCMCLLIQRFPESKDCLQLLRMAFTIVEMTLFLESEKKRRTMVLSPQSTAAFAQLFGPDKMDPVLLTACVSSMRKLDTFLCDHLDPADPSMHKWLSLELYALLRLQEDAEATSYVQERLRKFAKNKDVFSVISVLNLRALAQQGEEVEDLLSSNQDDVLVEAATHAIRFGLRHQQLGKVVAEEIEKSRTMMKQAAKSAQENVDDIDRLELCNELCLAHTTLSYGNFVEFNKHARWIFSNYQHLKKMDYWMLLSSFVFDDLRTATGFFAINGDYANQLRALTLAGVLLKKSRAPLTLVIDNQLRIVEALLFSGCLNNAAAALEKLEPLYKNLEFYCEDFYYLEAKRDRLRMWLRFETDDQTTSPEDLYNFTKQVRTPTFDKIRMYAMGRYFHAKAILKWNLQDSGKLVATDSLESGIRNMHSCLNNYKARQKSAMATWERFDIAQILLLTDTLRADVLFDLGSIKDTIAVTAESCSESQQVFSFYYLLRHIERTIRISLYFEHPIDAKMAIVSDLIDIRRKAAVENTKNASPPPEAEEEEDFSGFDLRTTDSIPYHSAMVLKMKHVQVASANNRLPAKEFLKFSKRRKHGNTCKCPLCYSVGIDLTLKQIDAVTAHITKDAFAGSEKCAMTRIESALTCLLNFLDISVREEQAGESWVRKIRTRHLFSLAHGYATDGNFTKALTFLDEIQSFQLSDDDELELCLRNFEYTYQINWQDAFAILNIHTNAPVQVPLANCNSDLFKTPAVTRKPVAKNAPARRGVRLPFDEPEPSTSSNEEPPEKKKPTKTDNPETASTVEEKPKPANKARLRKIPKSSDNSDKPTSVAPPESNIRVTRRKKNVLDLPRFEKSSKKTESIDDLFDDNEMSLANNFSKMSFKDRMKKPKTMDECDADQEFEKLLQAGRKYTPMMKQALLADLFAYLAFLSARRGKKSEFIFYMEKSVGIGVQLAARNRGSRMNDHFGDDVVNSDYFDILRFKTDFEPNWHERIWEWCSPDWIIVQLCAIMDGGTTPGLLATRYEKGHKPKVVYLSSSHDIQFQGALFKQYESIHAMNKVSLKMVERSTYWQVRREADTRLAEFCSTLENSWMACWKGMFVGKLHNSNQQIVDEFTEKIIKWAEAQGMQVDKPMLAVALSAIDALKLEQLVALFHKVFLADTSDKMKELQDLAIEILSEARCRLPTAIRRKPLIFVLDKHVINVPFESCSLFADSEVTRMPSVPLAVSHALLLNIRSEKMRNPFALENPADGFYCVNPGSDLPGSQERFLQEMDILAKSWDGEFGKPLTREDFKKFLRSKSLYLYCGHGTGRQHMREQIESLNVRAVSLIIGCSSGRMRTFGSKMDAEGYALRLLLGGAPAVLGNLWDITDRDIDVFTFSMLRKWLYKFFPDSSTCEPQLGAAVNQSRKDCRLKLLTGAAPVVYGLPCTSYSSP